MKEATRLFSKKPKENNLPGFNSTVTRQSYIFDKKYKQRPGPGQYEVCLPLVKPKYEAIFKNNRSIIIKVNDIPVPAFQSRQPRFKQHKTISYQQINEFEKDISQRDDNIFKKAKNSKRYNFLDRKKSISSISSKVSRVVSEKQEAQERNIKAPYWSKYKSQRKKWDINDSVPGPGYYNYSESNSKKALELKSWQFRSQTKRAFYNNDNKVDKEIPQEEEIKNHSIHSRYYKNY